MSATGRSKTFRLAAALLALGICGSTGSTMGAELPSPPSPSDAVTLDALPELGKPLPFHPESPFKLMVTSSHMEDACFIRVSGIVYTAAVDGEGLVSYLSTWDPAFRTPEGLGVGISVDELRAAGAAHFAYEYTAGCSAELPSGWRAGAEFVGQPLICKPQISWFFKKVD